MRSLGRSGVRIVLGLPPGQHAVRWSRYVNERWAHPPLDNFDAFLPALQTFLRNRQDITAVFPGGEYTRGRLLETGHTLPCPIVGVPDTLFEACRDKLEANQLAQSAGLLVPTTQVVTDLSSLQTFIDSCGFPAIVKPYRSKAELRGRKALILKSPEDVQTHLSPWPEEHQELLAQQYVTGPVEGADFVAADGELTAYCEATTERTDADDGTGYGVLFKSKAPTSDLLQATEAFAKSCQYSGPGLIQFIRTDDGQLYFIENNPRLSAGVATSINWGQDIPMRALEASYPELRSEKAADLSYEYNSLCYWLERDLEAYLRVRKSKTRKERGSIRQLIRQTFAQTNHHVLWSRSDPMPAVLQYTRMAYRFLKGSL